MENNGGQNDEDHASQQNVSDVHVIRRASFSREQLNSLRPVFQPLKHVTWICAGMLEPVQKAVDVLRDNTDDVGKIRNAYNDEKKGEDFSHICVRNVPAVSNCGR